jgi:hypothetical protein
VKKAGGDTLAEGVVGGPVRLVRESVLVCSRTLEPPFGRGQAPARVPPRRRPRCHRRRMCQITKPGFFRERKYYVASMRK